jgi:hypothetical protein
MLRRVGIPVIASLAATAGLAVADGPPSGPRATASSLRLPTVAGCVHRSVRVTFSPPGATVFSSLVVRNGDDDVLQLAGLTGAGSVKVTLPYGRSRIRASATTDDGRFLRTSRRYRRCTARPRPSPTPTPTATPVIGGGDQ